MWQAAQLRPRNGFTLVEVLVALLIMAIVAAMGWQGVAGMARARDIGSAASERTLRLSALVGQWEQDLAAVYDSPQVPGLSFDGASLRIARRVASAADGAGGGLGGGVGSGLGGDTGGGVQVVVWSLREGVWRRWTSPTATRQGDLQQAWLASQQLQGREAGQLKLLDGITDWQVYFWRGQGWSNAQSSGDVLAPVVVAAAASSASAPAGGASAPDANAANAANAAATPQRTALPTGVRLQIDLPEGRILRDVMLAPQTP